MRSAAQVFDPRHSRARAEAVMHGLAVEGDGNREVVAAMQMGFDAGMVAEQAALIDGLVAIFEGDKGLLGETVLFDDRELDGSEAVIRGGFEMRDLADSLALAETSIETIEQHSLLGTGVWRFSASPSLH